MLKNSIVRKDIRENQRGVDFLLRLKVVDVRGCIAIPGFVVDIWHASAYGVYYGFTRYQVLKCPGNQNQCQLSIRHFYMVGNIPMKTAW